eukprot:923010-Karenia_brevis.AAC.1
MEIGTINPVGLLLGEPGQIALFQDTLFHAKEVYDPKQKIPAQYGDTLDFVMDAWPKLGPKEM